MNFLRRLNTDRYGSALLILLGTGVVTQSMGFRVGTLTRMGAGFMPAVYGTLMVVVGVLIGLTSKSGPDGTKRPAEWRGWLCIVGGVAAFVLFGHYGGLMPATFASVFISALGDRQNTVRGAAILGVSLAVAGYFIFTLGLHLQLQPFAWG